MVAWRLCAWEILVQLSAINAKQLELGLQRQAAHGARLGTCLIELGLVGHDVLARALAHQHRVPAVLAGHLSRCDPRAVGQLTPALAADLVAFPVAFVNTGSGPSLAVALRDPRNPEAVAAVTNAVGTRILPSVCPERSILMMIEHVYGVPRPERYTAEVKRRKRRTTSVEIDFDEEDDESIQSGVHFALVNLDDESVPRDFSHYEEAPDPNAVSSLDAARKTMPPVAAPAPAPAPVPAAAPAPAPAPAPVSSPAPAPPPEGPPLTVASAIAQIRSAEARESMLDAVIGWLRGSFGAGLVVIARQGVALGHRACGCRFNDELVESILIPLSVPSAFGRAIESKQLFVGEPPDEGKTTHKRIFNLFPLSEPPSEIAVSPILVRDKVVCAIYAHPAGGGQIPPGALAELRTITTEVADGFARLIHRSKRG